WRKREGDHVARGDVLFEIETDKSAMEVEAFDEGVLLRIVAQEGATVPVNQVCAWVGQEGEAIPETPEPPAAAAQAAAAPAVTTAPVPAVATAPAAAVAPMAAPAPAPGEGSRLRISPRASRAAADAGIDPRTITGTGPEGRITEKDVTAAVAARAAAAPVPAPAISPAVAPADGEEEPRPLSRMRRVIADRLTASWTTIPHFTVTVAVDVTRLLALRAELKAAGTNLTVTDFVLSATAQTLAEFPAVNSRTDGVSSWARRRVHLGVAVSLPGGLVVPVIRDADRLTLGEIHDRAADLAVGARSGTLPVDDLTGSTFTVSNLGMFAVDEFSAIINPGEAAILAVASATPTVVAMGDGMAIRSIMKLTLSADHRQVDGELAARFLGALRRRLEDTAAYRSEALNS
ncbi:MAG: 2-oxo acid dehydrogenase subunit E2, partial [Chloroflexi bacterium]|nr:2-oxo acid dehydrogenase subunit E2 [Chloroflexota bacterium]